MAANLVAHIDLAVPPEVAYARICAVETWPVWLSCVKRVSNVIPRERLHAHSDILVCGDLSYGREEIYEVEQLIQPYLITFVGAFSCRRQIQFKIERQGELSHVHVKVAYPVHGVFADSLDRLTHRPRLHAALESSLHTLKGLLEHDAAEAYDRMTSLQA